MTFIETLRVIEMFGSIVTGILALLAFLQSRRNHVLINGRTTQLLNVTNALSKKEGKAEAKAEALGEAPAESEVKEIATQFQAVEDGAKT